MTKPGNGRSDFLPSTTACPPCGRQAFSSQHAHLALQHRQLMPQRGILCFKSALGLEKRANQVQEQKYQRDHRGRRYAILPPDQYGPRFRYTQVLARRDVSLDANLISKDAASLRLSASNPCSRQQVA